MSIQLTALLNRQSSFIFIYFEVYSYELCLYIYYLSELIVPLDLPLIFNKVWREVEIDPLEDEKLEILEAEVIQAILMAKPRKTAVNHNN